jgi:hypothetical protein
MAFLSGFHSSLTVGTKNHLETLKAIICVVDEQGAALSGLETWLNKLFTVHDPDVRLLLNHNTSSDAAGADVAGAGAGAGAGAVGEGGGKPTDQTASLTWCLKHDFELIDQDDNEDDDEEEGGGEEGRGGLLGGSGTGVGRVLDALQAHMWSGLIMKGKAGSKKAVKSAAVAGSTNQPQPTVTDAGDAGTGTGVGVGNTEVVGEGGLSLAAVDVLEPPTLGMVLVFSTAF